MTEKLKIFVCEFVTGGGLYNAYPLQSLPRSLAQEGDAMLTALLHDVLLLPHVEVITTRDPRLPALDVAVQLETAQPDVWTQWQALIDTADALWPVAPESDGLLARLCGMATGKKLIASDAAAIRLASSKRETVMHLAAAGIQSVPTFSVDAFESLPNPAGRWVAKPDDGAGCEATRRFDDAHTLLTWLNEYHAEQRSNFIVQPWLEGEAASLSLLCKAGEAQLLSANRQRITVTQAGDVHYHGSEINGVAYDWERFSMLAEAIAQALPGLAGYIGVDVVVNADTITVLEINPRLTTSYVGLHRAIGQNPAGLVLDLFYNDRFVAATQLQRHHVDVYLDD